MLVKVNGDIITKTELEQRQIATLQRMKADVRPRVASERRATPEDARRDHAEDSGRRRSTRCCWFSSAGRRAAADRRDVQPLAGEPAGRNRTSRTRQKFQGALKQEGMTIADLRRNVERTFLTQEIQRSEVGSKLQITEEEARQYYQLHKEEFVEPSSVTLREILIEVPSDDAAGAGRRERREGRPGGGEGGGSRGSGSLAVRTSRRSPPRSRRRRPKPTAG